MAKTKSELSALSRLGTFLRSYGMRIMRDGIFTSKDFFTEVNDRMSTFRSAAAPSTSRNRDQ